MVGVGYVKITSLWYWSIYEIYPSVLRTYSWLLFLASCSSPGSHPTNDIKGTEPGPVSTSTAPPNMATMDLTTKIEFLEKLGHHDLVRDLLAESYRTDGEIRLLQQWLDLDERWSRELQTANHMTKPTYFVPQSVEATSLLRSTSPVLASLMFGPIAGLIVYKELDRKKLVAREESHALPVADIIKAKATLGEYDELRTSQSQLRGILKASIRDKSLTSEIQEYQALFGQHYSYASRLIKARTEYLSYDLLSPNMARTQQLIYISVLKAPLKTPSFGRDKNLAREAAKVLAAGCGQNTLMEADEIVRDQFFAVFRALKELVGKEEFEELKVLQTLSDSISSEQKKGSERWWSK